MQFLFFIRSNVHKLKMTALQAVHEADPPTLLTACMCLENAYQAKLLHSIGVLIEMQ